MSNEILIKAEHVSKKFCRSLKRSLWYGVKDVAHSLMPWNASEEDQHEVTGELPPLRSDEFWAIQNISFELRRGECLGLIGHNGAGKSTLLKILNSLNRPDTGQITLRGRVGALIELSAGFNPILSGRENIFNQSALLGFSKRETEAKFDAIVDFSELEDFLDMPVQNYSSGMKVRLGFAVSSQMEPDILLVDEVLAVGDVGFRFKCLNKMADLLNRCAVIFVSHSMPQIMRVSTEIMVLNRGVVDYLGHNLSQGLEAYFGLFAGGETTTGGSGQVRIPSLTVSTLDATCGLGGNVTVAYGDKLTIRIDLACDVDVEQAVLQVLFWNHELIPVLDVISEGKHGFVFSPAAETNTVVLEIDRLPLNAGRHHVSVIVTDPNLERTYCQIDHAVLVTVVKGSLASGAGCLVTGNWKTETAKQAAGHN
jgi:lipopolysaccharide transport system ATP-binding protein